MHQWLNIVRWGCETHTHTQQEEEEEKEEEGGGGGSQLRKVSRALAGGMVCV